MNLGEKAKLRGLPSNSAMVFDAENMRECILESLVDELVHARVALDETDILDIARDALDYPKDFVDNRKYRNMSLHKFSKDALQRCKLTDTAKLRMKNL